MTEEEKRTIDASFPTLGIFAWCLTCQTLLIGAAEYNSFWGKKTSHIAQIHRRGTNHEVYVGPNKDTQQAST